MKVMTLLGTRPEIIRLSRIIPRLDALCQHVLVHTGQNFEPALSDVFFEQLRLRAPDRHLGVRASTFGGQVGRMLEASESALSEEKPDRLLILGDTNSGLSAVVAKRLGIPVYHLEAGNRCYDDRVPEEVNRRVIDHCSDVLMPYTERSRAHLVREGIHPRRIYVIGNPIYEVLEHYRSDIERSNVMAGLGLEKQRFFLATLHRAENVDDRAVLEGLIRGLREVRQAHKLPIVVSTHPRTQDRLRGFGIDPGDIRFLPPFGFFDFVALEQNALCVLTDSGTVQEECSIFRVPNVTLRRVTERPETLEAGSNLLAGVEPAGIERAVRIALDHACDWTAPPEYLKRNVSDTVVRIALGAMIG